MSILRSSARHSSAFRRSSRCAREALLDARRGTVTHRATTNYVIKAAPPPPPVIKTKPPPHYVIKTKTPSLRPYQRHCMSELRRKASPACTLTPLQLELGSGSSAFRVQRYVLRMTRTEKSKIFKIFPRNNFSLVIRCRPAARLCLLPLRESYETSVGIAT